AKLTLSEAHTQPSAPYVTPSLEARIEVMSSPVISRRDSLLQLRTNGDGQLQIEQGGKPLQRQQTMRGGEVIAVPFHVDRPATSFKVTFTPEKG
ncbi:right-handed parallel beta-helix repeat-containing protein, partial [Salmonella sp. hn-h4]|nr:right-handed parallel beta-helix repeat-containing protein [Salmonella sp. hn-h4]